MEIPWILNVFEHHELMTKLTLQEGVDLFSFLIEYDLGQILVGRSAKITSCQNFCHKNTLYTGVFKVAVNVHYFSDDIFRAGGSSLPHEETGNPACRSKCVSTSLHLTSRNAILGLQTISLPREPSNLRT